MADTWSVPGYTTTTLGGGSQYRNNNIGAPGGAGGGLFDNIGKIFGKAIDAMEPLSAYTQPNRDPFANPVYREQFIQRQYDDAARKQLRESYLGSDKSGLRKKIEEEIGGEEGKRISRFLRANEKFERREEASGRPLANRMSDQAKASFLLRAFGELPNVARDEASTRLLNAMKSIPNREDLRYAGANAQNMLDQNFRQGQLIRSGRPLGELYDILTGGMSSQGGAPIASPSLGSSSLGTPISGMPWRSPTPGFNYGDFDDQQGGVANVKPGMPSNLGGGWFVG